MHMITAWVTVHLPYVGLFLAETDLESEDVYDIISNPHTPIAFAITCTEKNPAKHNIIYWETRNGGRF